MNETLFSNYHPRWQKKGADEQNYNHPRECMLYKARLSNQTITRNGLNSTCISKRTWHLQKWNKWNHYFSVSRKNISWPRTHNRTVPKLLQFQVRACLFDEPLLKIILWPVVEWETLHTLPEDLQFLCHLMCEFYHIGIVHLFKTSHKKCSKQNYVPLFTRNRT